METKPHPIESANLDRDLKSLRLSANYGATIGVKKILTNIPVGKPKKTQFFRVHESVDMTFPTLILEIKETRETYLVYPDVAQVISELVRPVMLLVAIDRQNNIFIIPVPLPGESGTRNQWHESLAQAAEMSKKKWVRIVANMHIGSYEVQVATGVLAEPDWPEENLDELIKIAFRGKIISDANHPIVQSLLGEL
jgi:hypothetical protein